MLWRKYLPESVCGCSLTADLCLVINGLEPFSGKQSYYLWADFVSVTSSLSLSLSTSSELLTSDDGVTRSWVLIIPGPLLTNCHQPHTTQTPSHDMLASDWLLSVLSGLSLVTHHPTKSDHQTVSSIINNIQHTLSTFHYPPCYNIGRVQIRWNNIYLNLAWALVITRRSILGSDCLMRNSWLLRDY